MMENDDFLLGERNPVSENKVDKNSSLSLCEYCLEESFPSPDLRSIHVCL
jgi:hypothetical protein